MSVCEVEEAVELEEAKEAAAGCGAAREYGEFDCVDMRFARGALRRGRSVGLFPVSEDGEDGEWDGELRCGLH